MALALFGLLASLPGCGEALEQVWCSNEPGHSGSVDSVAWSPDGVQLVTVGGNSLLWWRPDSGTAPDQSVLESSQSHPFLIWSPDGRFVVAASNEDAVISVFDATSHVLIAWPDLKGLEGMGQSLFTLAFEESGKRLMGIVRGDSPINETHTQIVEWETESWRLVRRVQIPDCSKATFFDKGRQAVLLDMSNQQGLTVMQTQSLKTAPLKKSEDDLMWGMFTDLVGSQKSTVIAFAEMDASIDMEEKGNVATRVGWADADNTMLRFSGHDVEERFRSHKEWDKLQNLIRKSRIALSPDMKHIFHAGRLIDMETGLFEEMAEPEVFNSQFSPDGRRIAVGGPDGVTRVWQIEQLDRPPLLLPATGRTAVAMTVAKEDGYVAIQYASGSVIVRDLGTGALLQSYPCSRCVTPGLEAAARGDALVLPADGSQPGLRLLAHPRTGRPFREIRGCVEGVAVAPDGRTLACDGPVKGRLLLLDAESGAIMAEVEVEGGRHHTFRWSEDGSTLIVADRTSVGVVDVRAARATAVRPLPPHVLSREPRNGEEAFPLVQGLSSDGKKVLLAPGFAHWPPPNELWVENLDLAESTLLGDVWPEPATLSGNGEWVLVGRAGLVPTGKGHNRLQVKEGTSLMAGVFVPDGESSHHEKVSPLQLVTASRDGDVCRWEFSPGWPKWQRALALLPLALLGVVGGVGLSRRLYRRRRGRTGATAVPES